MIGQEILRVIAKLYIKIKDTQFIPKNTIIILNEL